MAKNLILQNLTKLARGIGASHNKWTGTKTNITFLGKGPTKNPLFQGPLQGLESASEAQLGSRESVISTIEDAMGYASAGKLNGIQLRALELNLESLYKIYNPPPAFMGWKPDIVPKAEGGLAHILQVPRSGMRIGGMGLLTKGIRGALKRVKKSYDTPGANFSALTDDASYLMSPVNMQKIKKLELYRQQLVRNILRKEGGGKFTHGADPEATRADLQLLDDYIAKLKNKIKEVGYYGEGAAKEKALVGSRPDLPFPKFIRDKFKHAEGGRAGYSKGRTVKGALAILNRNKKNAEYMFKASDNVSPGYAKGDMKYNAELLADQLAEDAGVVYHDLGDLERIKFYGTAYDYLAKEMGMMLQMKNLGKVLENKQMLREWTPPKGRKPNASGGLAHILQVPTRSGYSRGRAVKSLMGLVNKKFGKGTLKRASDLPKGTKYEELEAVKAFEQRHPRVDDLGGYKTVEKDFDFSDMYMLEPAAQLKQLIIKKYKGRIDDKLLQQMLADDNPQRLAEVMATVDEALLMQAKGMNPESIIASFKEAFKRKPNASGGLAGILEV